MSQNNLTSELAAMMTLISIDDQRLVIPQHQIVTLEPVEDLNHKNCVDHSVGWIITEAGQIPVYNLDNELMLTNLDEKRRIVIVLANAGGDYAILADELNILSADTLVWQELPWAIRSNESPVNRVAVYEQTLICLTNADDLFNDLIFIPEEKIA
jgi:hypothetical protein